MFNFLSDPWVLLSTSAVVWLSGVGATRLGETDGLPVAERALKSDLALRFGPQLPSKAIAAQFDKITGAFIATAGLQNFARPDFSTPIIDTFSTLGQLALSFEEVQSVCVSRCHNNPACKAVGVYGPLVGTCGCTSDEDGETKTSYSCRFINPDLGPGAYIAQEPDGYRATPDEPGVVYTKKAGNPTVVPSYDDVACNISTFTIVDDITCYYGCFPGAVGACFSSCVIPCVDNDCVDQCAHECFVQGDTQCVNTCGLTNDFHDYILPATNCLVNKGGGVALDSCLTCLTSGRAAGQIAGTLGICTANNETNFVRGPCQDECHEVPVNGTNSTLDLSICEPMLQAAMLCFNGANVGFAPNSTNGTAGGGVNRYDSTTLFACPE